MRTTCVSYVYRHWRDCIVKLLFLLKARDKQTVYFLFTSRLRQICFVHVKIILFTAFTQVF